MESVTLIGIDLGKRNFHVHGQDRQGKALLRKKFSRKQLIEFLPIFIRARLSWKPAREHISWPGNWPASAMSPS